MTDLLAASLRPPTGPASRAATVSGRSTPAECDCGGDLRLRRSVPASGGGGAVTSSVGRRATDGAADHRRRAQGAPPATCLFPRPSGRRACAARPAAASFGRESNASGGTGGSSRGGSLRGFACFPGPARSRRTESSRHRISRAHPFTSEQFHVLLNSLFKVLCNFPSRYLFAIGLTAVFSLRWSLPPDWGCTPKQPDSEEIASETDGAAMGLAPALDRPRSGGLAAPSGPGALTP